MTTCFWTDYVRTVEETCVESSLAPQRRIWIPATSPNMTWRNTGWYDPGGTPTEFRSLCFNPLYANAKAALNAQMAGTTTTLSAAFETTETSVSDNYDKSLKWISLTGSNSLTITDNVSAVGSYVFSRQETAGSQHFTDFVSAAIRTGMRSSTQKRSHTITSLNFHPTPDYGTPLYGDLDFWQAGGTTTGSKTTGFLIGDDTGGRGLLLPDDSTPGFTWTTGFRPGSITIHYHLSVDKTASGQVYFFALVHSDYEYAIANSVFASGVAYSYNLSVGDHSVTISPSWQTPVQATNLLSGLLIPSLGGALRVDAVYFSSLPVAP